MTVQRPNNRADHQRPPRMAPRPLPPWTGLTVLIAAPLLFGLGLVTIRVLSTTGGSIALSPTGMTVTVNAPQ